MLFSTDSIASEAINFQVNSGFPKELESIFQKAFDFVNKYDTEHTLSSVDDFAKKYVAFKEYFRINLCPLFIKVIKKYTGFNVNQITLSTPADYNGIFGFWMQPIMSDLDPAYNDELTNLWFNIKGFQDLNKLEHTEFVDKFIELSKSLDKKTGKYVDNKVFRVDINIPLGMFSVKDVVDNNDNNQLTIKEFTAIILHEIGHIMTIVEYMRDLGYVGYFGNNVLRDISDYVKTNPKQAIKAAITLGEKESNKVKNTAHAKILKTALSILKSLQSKVEEHEQNLDEKENYSSNMISFFLLVLIMMVFVIIGMTLMIPAMFVFPSDWQNVYDYLDKNKNREIGTVKNFSVFERIADEYVSRFQYSKYLNSGLMKFGKIIDELMAQPGAKPIFNKVLRNSTILRTIAYTLRTPGMLLNYLMGIKENGISSEYEHDILRFRRNINNLHDVLKSGNIPENIRASIVNDIDEMEDQLLAISKDLNLNAIEKALKFIMNIIPSVGGFTTDIFSKNNPYKEYEHLFEYLDNMLSNKSFYYASKIKILMKK